MISTSVSYREALHSDSRNFYARLTFLDNNQTTNDFTFEYSHGCNAESSFSVGATISAKAEITLLESISSVYTGRKVKIELGLDVGTAVEYAQLGVFTVTKAPDEGSGIKLYAYDRMSFLNTLYVCALSNCTVWTVLNDICSQLGVPLITKLANSTLLNNTVIKPEGYTYRETLMYLSMCVAGFAYFDNQERLVVSQFGTGSVTQIDGDRTYDLRLGDTNYACYNFTVHVSDEIKYSLTTPGKASVEISNPIMTESTFNTIKNLVVGKQYRPGEIEILGDHLIEPCDYVLVNGEYLFYPMMYSHSFDGGLTTEIICRGDTESESETSFQGPVTKQMERYYSELLLVKDLVADKASIAYLEANYATINSLAAVDAKFNTLSAVYATITSLNAVNARFDTLNATYATITALNAVDAKFGTLSAQYASITALNAVDAKFGTLSAQYATITDLSAVDAKFGTLSATYATISSLNAVDAKFNTLSSTYATITALNAVDAKFGTLSVQYATITALNAVDAKFSSLNTQYATIDMANIDMGAIKTAMIGESAITSVQIKDGSITNAKIAELSANKITAGTLSVERLEIRGTENSIVYALNNITGALQSENVDRLNGEILEDRTITPDKVVANSITANEIDVADLRANMFIVNKIEAGEINVVNLRANLFTVSKITATEIDVANLFAQNITATGTITGLKLSAATGAFSGTITASAGTIAVWTLSSSAIYKTSSTFGASNGMYFGSSGISITDKFKVTSSGAITSTSGNIGGWNIGTGSLYKDGLTLDSVRQELSINKSTDNVTWVTKFANGSISSNYEYAPDGFTTTKRDFNIDYSQVSFRSTDINPNSSNPGAAIKSNIVIDNNALFPTLSVIQQTTGTAGDVRNERTTEIGASYITLYTEQDGLRTAYVSLSTEKIEVCSNDESSSGSAIYPTFIRENNVPLDEKYVQYQYSGIYPGLYIQDSLSSWIRSPQSGFIGYSNGTSNLGTNSWRWNQVHANTIYENGKTLSSSYGTIALEGYTLFNPDISDPNQTVNIAPNSWRTMSFSFQQPFTQRPTVNCFWVGTSVPHLRYCRVIDITSTTFTVLIYNGYGESIRPGIRWTAFGK